jgi:P27 family predicted phage terminase small subunit
VPELRRLGLLTVVDRAALAGYCQSYARWVQAEKVLEKGMTFTTSTGYIQQRPEVAIAQKSLQLMKSFLIEFGLTPASRTRLSVPEKEEDELDAILSASR